MWTHKCCIHTHACMCIYLYSKMGRQGSSLPLKLFNIVLEEKVKGTRDLKTGNQEVKLSLFAEVITISLEH